MKPVFRTLVLAAYALALISCSSQTRSITPPTSPATTGFSGPAGTAVARFPKNSLGGILYSVSLMDAPPNIGGIVPTSVNLAVVAVAASAPSGENSTIVGFPQPQIIDVMQYQSGAAPLGGSRIGQDNYKSLLLVLQANESSLVIGGQSYPLQFNASNDAESSAGVGDTSTSYFAGPGYLGIAVDLDAYFRDDQNGSSAGYVLDFNVLESIGQSPNGSYFVRPVVFAAPEGIIGKIAGSVAGANGPVSGAVVVASSERYKLVTSTATGADGTFEMHNLPAGKYTLTVYNKYTTAAGQHLTATGQSADASDHVKGFKVTVNANATTTLNPISD